mgnify:CR=1 FL=1
MKNIDIPLTRNKRYRKAAYWVSSRARMLPGVVFTAAMDVQDAGGIDCYNLSCWAEGPRLRFRTWRSKGDGYASNDI